MTSYPDRLVIISTHRPAALKLCDRIYRIGEGTIRETTLEEALTLKKDSAPEQTAIKQELSQMQFSMPMVPPGKREHIPDEGWWKT